MAASFPLSDHCNGTHFFNPDIGEQPDRRGFWQLLRWRFGTRRVPWPLKIDNDVYAPPTAPAAGHAAITFIGHASFLIQLPGTTFLTDPVFSDRASPVAFAGHRRVRPPGISLAQLPKIDVILLSHNHYDHADLASLRAIQAAHAPHAITMLGNAKLLAKAGLRAHELDWWDATKHDELHITATPARHFSRRGLTDGNAALWGGFMLELGHARILFAGDSAGGPHWGTVAERLGPPDLSLLPIGAYAPTWLMAPVHMNPEQAVEAHLALRAHHSIAMHFGTFRLTDEAIDEPVRRLAAACQDQNISNFHLLGVGETRMFDLRRDVTL
jgi:L-ascorbate metabolism protein UlaG (beta-lactamase superfamily)